MTMQEQCGYEQQWVGPCKNEKPCPDHKDKKCWECGKPATKECGFCGFLVCGMPECDEHPHMHTHGTCI